MAMSEQNARAPDGDRHRRLVVVSRQSRVRNRFRARRQRAVRSRGSADFSFRRLPLTL